MIIKILEKIWEHSDIGISFIGLLEEIPSLNKKNDEALTKLRIILSALIEDGLIEERHSIDGEDKTVDYVIENKGRELLKKLGKLKLHAGKKSKIAG